MQENKWKTDGKFPFLGRHYYYAGASAILIYHLLSSCCEEANHVAVMNMKALHGALVPNGSRPTVRLTQTDS